MKTQAKSILSITTETEHIKKNAKLNTNRHTKHKLYENDMQKNQTQIDNNN